MQTYADSPREEVKRPPVPVYRQSADRPRSNNSNNLEFILDKTDNDNWSTRVNAFERLDRKLQDEEEAITRMMQQNPTLWDKLVNAHVNHINDSHFKVSSTCINSLRQMTEMYPEKLSFHLEQIIQKLIASMADTKEQVAMATGHYVEVINDLYMAEDLLPLFLKFSSFDAKPKLKVKIFDIFVDLVEKSENYFDSVSVVKGYIKVIFGMIDPSMK